MIDKDLKIYDSVCTGCSACTEACAFPDDTGISPIQLILNGNNLFVPRINSDTCTTCMACYKACPTEDKIFNEDITFSNYQKKIGKSYFGYTLDQEHRYEAATAGISTEIASFLLETKQVDGVVSSYQNKKNEIVTQIFTDIKEVKKTRGSIYRQVPLLNGLAEKIEIGKHKKLLVIGLPCHIAGLKTLHQTNKYLKKNIEFITIALFCKQTKTEEFSKMQRSLLKGRVNQRIDYRGKGWPGITRIEGGNTLPSSHIKLGLMWSSFAFTPDYCFTCSDPIGVNADISIGDAWLEKYYHDNKGSSLFVANTLIGEIIIEKMLIEKKIYASEETTSNIIASQSTNHIKFKTSNVNIRSKYFGFTSNSNNISKYILLIKWIKLNKKIVEKLYRLRLIQISPSITLRVYAKVLQVFFTKLSKD